MYKLIIFYIRNLINYIEQYVLYYYFRLFLFKAITHSSDKKPRVLFGPCPIINNKYWAKALSEYGYEAHSITCGIPIINSRSDFDLIIDELFPIKGKKNNFSITRQKLQVFSYAIREYDIFVMAFRFNYFDDTYFFKKEAGLLHKYGKKVIIIPYGSDYYRYSKIIDHSLKHNLLINVPDEVFKENLIQERVDYWVKYADFIIMSQMIDYASRWDCLPVNCLCIDLEQWVQSKRDQVSDGTNECVYIAHTPNHRGFKGTEFIYKAVEELKAEGLKVELILIEKKPNSEVRQILMEKADILVEQIIFTGYALSGIEGMASGLTVVSNFSNSEITNLFRRYSYLNECPIFSGSPETIKETLRVAITTPSLRKKLGEAGRKYAEKYHSYHTFVSLFTEIEKKIWRSDPSADPMNFFNPQNPASYNNQSERVSHPLHNSRLPV